jgi:glycosyltransferase involved in cell wall biosynthesis
VVLTVVDGRIRVCHIVTRLAVRGVPRHVIDMAVALDPQRYAVQVLTGHSEPGEGDLWQEALDLGIAVRRIPALQRRVDLRADVLALWQLYRYLRAYPCDIVHTHISKAGILGRMAARWAGVPLVLHTYHGVPLEWAGSGLAARLFRLCERRVSRSTSALVAVSQAVKNDLLQMGIGEAKRMHVIYNGVHAAMLAEGIGAQAVPWAPLLLCIGSLTREKGLAVLLKGLPELRVHFPNLGLGLVGDGPLKEDLQHLISELDLDACVHFAGIVEDVRPWLAACAVLVMPSLSEGMGLAAVEAMAMGRPVVASDVGGLREVVVDGETGLLVESGNSHRLAQQIRSLLQKPDELRRMGDNGCQRVQRHFTVERAIGQLQDLYEELLQIREDGA